MSRTPRPSNFSGSVTRRGRSYWIRYSGPADPLTGKRRRICETVKVGTEKEAWDEIKKRQAAIVTGNFVNPNPLTLGAYVDEWFVNYPASPKTRERVRGYLDKQILPFLGKLRLQALDKDRIRAWHEALAERGHYRGGPLAPQTVRNCHRALRRALRDAVPQLLPRNPLADCPTPKVPYKPHQVLARADARTVLDRLAGHEYLQGVAALALGGGLRIGEIIALTPGDVDFTANTVSISKAITTTRADGPFFKSPKTAAGYRTVQIDPVFLSYLRSHCERVEWQRRATGMPPLGPADQVFTRPGGALLDSSKVSRDFANVRRARGLPVMNLHGLRHFHASVLLAANYDLPRLARRLGHGSPDITLRIYAHALPHEADPAAGLVGAVLGAAPPPIAAGGVAPAAGGPAPRGDALESRNRTRTDAAAPLDIHSDRGSICGSDDPEFPKSSNLNN
jgi:integrase